MLAAGSDPEPAPLVDSAFPRRGSVKRFLVIAAVLAPLVVVVVEGRAQDGADAPPWRKLRADAPPEPKGAPYSWKEPEGWTPPSREELEKEAWTDGRLTDPLTVGRERIAQVKPAISVADALALKNNGREDNAKIAEALAQYPASDDDVDWDATMNRFDQAPTTLNPMLASSRYENDMSLSTASPWNFDYNLGRFADADVTKRWRHSEKMDLIELRDDLTWDDGTPFTAYDIEFSYHVVMDPKVPVPAQRTGASQLKWVKAYDARTVVYFHKEALPSNVWNVSFSILPKHIYEHSLSDDPSLTKSDWHVYWNRNPLASGPYRVKEWLTGQQIVFERRDAYYEKDGNRIRPKPYFKQVRFRLIEDANAALLALKKGELDEMILAPQQWARQTDDDDFYKYATKVRGPEWTYSFVGWNERPVPDKPFFKDKRVRKALALAFDQDEVLKKVMFDLYDPCTGPFHPASPWGATTRKPITQNADEAEKLLDEAGWKDGGDGVRAKDGVRFEFTISVPMGGIGDKIAAVLKQNLKDVGIVMNIKMIEWATYQTQVQDHEFEACTMSWGSGTDPDTSRNIWLTEMYDKTKGRNSVGYSNSHVDELFEQGRHELDPAKRSRIYQEINDAIFEDQPYLFICYRATLWAFSKDMRGYNFSPRGPFGYGPGLASMWKPKKKAP
jgi:peptide/nickel transport system substrate-binding protein